MKLKEDIKSISYIKSNAADILNQVNKTHRPVIVTQNGEARAVLMDPESYDRMNHALKLLKILAQGENDIAEKKYDAQDVFFSSLENRLNK